MQSLPGEYIIEMFENISVYHSLSQALFLHLVSAMRKLWCRTKMGFSLESILAQISATYWHFDLDNTAHCAYILPCKNGTIISIYLIRPL